jgi:hypothetical protein
MKKNSYILPVFTRSLIIIGVSASLVVLLSFLGYPKIWLFTKNPSDNGFIVGAIVVIISGIMLTNHTGDGGFYTVSRMNKDYDDQHKYMGFASFFTAGVILLLFSAFLMLIAI